MTGLTAGSDWNNLQVQRTKIAITADNEAIVPQVEVPPEDCNYQSDKAELPNG